MANLVYIATSMDGYIADRNGKLDWLVSYPNPEKSDFGYAEFVASVDAVVLGRKTYETVVRFEEWPYKVPVYVLSNSLLRLDDRVENKATLLSGTPPEVVKKLTGKGFKQLYIDGGVTIQGFLEFDLIDRMTIFVIPVLLGSGTPLFKKGGTERKFTTCSAHVFGNGIIKLEFARRR